jgi:hypothetical protein
MRYIVQYALEICVLIAAHDPIMRLFALLLMGFTTYMWLRRGDHIGR